MQIADPAQLTICRRTSAYRQSTIHAHIHTYMQFRTKTYPKVMLVCGLWEEKKTHGENMQIPQTGLD